MVAVSTATIALAMSVTPVMLDMKSSGRAARSDIEVSNTSAIEIPVAVNVSEATIAIDGKVTTKPVDDQFLIYPAQALVKPGETQHFRVQWIGDPELANSKIFIFSVAQQPVELPKGQSGIQIVYNFEVLAAVAPIGKDPQFSVSDSEFTKIKEKRRASFTIANNSNAHGYLSGCRVKLEAKDKSGRTVWTKDFEPEDISQNVGAGIISGNATRKFTLPFDLPEGGESLSASIRYVGRR